jgi:hypothetical protein
VREKASAAGFVIGAVVSLLGGGLMGMAFPGTCLVWVIAGVACYVGCGSRAMASWRMDEKIFEQPAKLHPPIPGRTRWIASWLLLGAIAVPGPAQKTSLAVPLTDDAAVLSRFRSAAIDRQPRPL